MEARLQCRASYPGVTQDHSSITEQFKCQVLHRKGNARALFAPQNMQRLCSPPATALFAPRTQLSQSHQSSPKQHNSSVKHGTPNEKPRLSKRHWCNKLMEKMQSNNRTCKTKEITYIISCLNEDDSEWCKKNNRAATRYQYIPQHRQFVSWNRM